MPEVIYPSPAGMLPTAVGVILGAVLVWFAVEAVWTSGREALRGHGWGWLLAALTLGVVASFAVAEIGMFLDAMVYRLFGSSLLAALASAAFVFAGYVAAVAVSRHLLRGRVLQLVSFGSIIAAVGAAAHFGYGLQLTSYLSEGEPLVFVGLVLWPVVWLLAAVAVGLLASRNSGPRSLADGGSHLTSAST